MRSREAIRGSVAAMADVQPLKAVHYDLEKVGGLDAVASPPYDVIDAAERDPDLAKVHAGIHAGHISPFYTVIERARKRGEIARRRNASEVVASVVGPIFYRRWFSREPLDKKFVEAVIEGALSAATRDS